MGLNLCPYLCQILAHNSFNVRLHSKFATKSMMINQALVVRLWTKHSYTQ